MSDILDGLNSLLDRVRRAEYRTARIDRDIGSAYATIRSSLDWYSLPMNRLAATDIFLIELIDAWRERYGAEKVSETLRVLGAERGA